MADLDHLSPTQLEAVEQIRQQMEDSLNARIKDMIRPRTRKERLHDVAKLYVGYRIAMPDGSMGTITSAESSWNFDEPERVDTVCTITLDEVAKPKDAPDA